MRFIIRFSNNTTCLPYSFIYQFLVLYLKSCVYKVSVRSNRQAGLSCLSPKLFHLTDEGIPYLLDMQQYHFFAANTMFIAIGGNLLVMIRCLTACLCYFLHQLYIDSVPPKIICGSCAIFLLKCKHLPQYFEISCVNITSQNQILFSFNSAPQLRPQMTIQYETHTHYREPHSISAHTPLPSRVGRSHWEITLYVHFVSLITSSIYSLAALKSVRDLAVSIAFSEICFFSSTLISEIRFII